MIEQAFQKLDQLMNLLHSMEQLNDLKPDGPLKAKTVRYPVNTNVELDPCVGTPSAKAIRDPMRDIYKTSRKNYE